MSMKSDQGIVALLNALELPSIKFSRRRRPSNPAQQVQDVHYDVFSASDMAKALQTTTSE